MVSQQQIGTTDVGGGIAATRVGSIDDERPRGVAQDVDGMKIAVAQALAVRHVGETAEQGHPARRVQKFGPGDVRREPQLEAAELERRVGMNARLQARARISRCVGTLAGSSRIRSASDAGLTRSNTMPQRPSICCTLQTAGTGRPSASTAAWIAASRNATGLAAGDR